ncbi:MAG: flagellar biosynthetic protein [Sphingopyxis sp.]|uniref:FliH/SctL family protein n=1 Tax=Sphingopyxis sp. TaxID=1908224 RepID=UPI001A20F598|nr:FliH/SctL family protein [Sphingopyxis sp.]MBJ7501333.1 flagellar biosynthetic protein [Sphingopyxis sp.]
MSDRAAETGFAPVSLIDAMARGGGFRPISFAPSVHAPQPVETSFDEPDLDDPFALGLAEGQRLAEAAFVAERHQLLALLAGAEALQDEPSEELAQLIATTVERLVRQIVATAPIDTEWLEAQVATAAAMIADADKARTLWVHPEDAALLADAPLAMAIESDTAMMRGTVRIETSTGWIEHGRAVYLEELRSALGEREAA